ncbi:formate dehydrogenase accessory protein FdhE [Ramlibacter sp. G-1-2-2]|uniref:Protein FdhE homolog n=1 Tax=Ramlibacter agri TaxID=2728837 RepID=A0A848HAT6_9BURK|nr:formate dehydrogenase accessory protein FdhE [Ramlibacter agri]NML46619.1 formate dehydrogenase accessory protein FdhE [Ramlibacter agri]
MNPSPLLSPEEIAARAGQQASLLYMPVRGEVFADRAIRLRQRAAGHAMRDYLLLVADIAQAQHAVLQDFPAVRVPDPQALMAAAYAGQPPLPAPLWPRAPQWRDGLHPILDALLQRLPSGPTRTAVEALRGAPDEMLERQADRLLDGVTLGLDLAAAPFIAAALQVYWTHLVLATQEAHGTDRLPPFGRVDDPTRCPCCGSRPVASVIRIDPGAGGLRYLQCSLCSTQWHMVRVKCSRCLSTKGIEYRLLAPMDGGETARQPAVEAETCDECGSYLKIVRRDRDPLVEAVADDLASVTLDLLVEQAGFENHGVNLMLLFGDPDGGGG